MAAPPTLFLAEAYLHRLDPFVLRFTDTFGIRWYGLAYAVGFLIGWLFLRWMARTRRSPLTLRDTGDLMLPIILGVLVGGRLGYCIFYEPHLLIDFSGSFPFWGVLAITRGGMASHGGMIGVIIACTWFARTRRISGLHLIDLGAFGCTAGFFLGRIANFINGELWGRPIARSLQTRPPWWSVKYPDEITDHWLRIVDKPQQVSMDLVQTVAHDFGITGGGDALRQAVAHEAMRRLELIETQLGPVLGNDKQFYERLMRALHDGSAAAHQRAVEIVQPLLTAYYPSQLLQSLTDGLMVAIVLALIWLKPRKPGVIGSWWLIVYGVLRITTEEFRQPDVGVATIVGLSRGQQLSILMVLGGIACLVIASRRHAPRIGGLLTPGSAADATDPVRTNSNKGDDA